MLGDTVRYTILVHRQEKQITREWMKPIELIVNRILQTKHVGHEVNWNIGEAGYIISFVGSERRFHAICKALIKEGFSVSYKREKHSFWKNRMVPIEKDFVPYPK